MHTVIAKCHHARYWWALIRINSTGTESKAEMGTEGGSSYVGYGTNEQSDINPATALAANNRIVYRMTSKACACGLWLHLLECTLNLYVPTIWCTS